MANLLIKRGKSKILKKEKKLQKQTNEQSRHDSILAFSVCEIVKGFTRKQKKTQRRR